MPEAADAQGPEPEPEPERPRFAVVQVTVGGRKAFAAMDLLTKLARWPADASSRAQCEALVAVLATEARTRGQPLTVRLRPDAVAQTAVSAGRARVTADGRSARQARDLAAPGVEREQKGAGRR